MVVFPFVLFLLAIVLSVLLPFTDSDYPFGIFKLFLWESYNVFIQIEYNMYISKLMLFSA
jgi:hypothetical protein